MGLPAKAGAGKRPATCSRALLKKVWHDGFDAGEANKSSGGAVELAQAVALSAGVDPTLVQGFGGLVHDLRGLGGRIGQLFA